MQDKMVHGGQRGSFFTTAPSQMEPAFTGNPQPSFLARPGQISARAKPGGKGILWRLGLASEDTEAVSKDSKVLCLVQTASHDCCPMLLNMGTSLYLCI